MSENSRPQVGGFFDPHCIPTSPETDSRQRTTLQLPTNLQPLCYIQNNWTCCKKSIYWSSCLQWASQSSPVCLLNASLHWNSPTVYDHDCHLEFWASATKRGLDGKRLVTQTWLV